MNHGYIHSICTLLDVPHMTSQQVTFVIHFLRVRNAVAAAHMVGVQPATARGWLSDDPSMPQVLQHLAERETHEFEVTKGMLNDMLMEAWTISADATEKVAVVRELGKLNGQYPDSKGNTLSVNAQINVGGEKHGQVEFKGMKQIQQMSDSDLQQLAGNRFADSLINRAPREDDQELVYDQTLDMHVPAKEAKK
jgi:phage terminase small subunit